MFLKTWWAGNILKVTGELPARELFSYSVPLSSWLSPPPGFVSLSLIDLWIYSLEKQNYFLEGWRGLCTSRCHFSRWRTVVLFFFLHLPLVGSFLWSVLSAVHHGSGFRPADVQQLLLCCLNVLTLRYTSKAGMNNLQREKKGSGG